MASTKAQKDLIATAKERYKLAEEAEREIRREAKIDLEFAAGNQWDPNDVNQRNAAGGGGLAGRRPCLTFNKLTGPLNQVANQARMNKPDIEVLPADMSGDLETAHVIEGMIRQIEYSSKADQVWETSLDQSTKGGFGYFKVITRYCGNKTFNQELRIERIVNPFNVYIDPFAKEADKSDAMWAFELEWYPKDEYKDEFGETEVVRMNFFEGVTNPAPQWIGDNGVLVARYWYVDIEVKTLVSIRWPDGVLTDEYLDNLPDELPPGVQFNTDSDGNRLEREDEIRHIKMCRLNGVEVLDETDWKGQWIPLLATLGEEMYIEDKRYLFSLIRFARDPQRLYNFYRSSEAETVMLGTKAPWVGVKGAFRDPRWATANAVPWAYLEYEPLDIAGNPVPMPQRNLAEPPIQALSIGAAQASDDIKATTNVYDASLGAQSNETSGVAIKRRQGQMELSNFHFVDNLNRAILQCGNILVDLIPKIYDTPREVRILGADMKEQIVKVNQRYKDEDGIERCYDLSNGKYDVRLRIGPSFKTQQEETASQLVELSRSYPQLMQVAGDVVFDNLNFNGAEKIADRLRRSMPPGLVDDPGKKPQELLAQQNAQQAQTIDQLTAVVNKQNEDIRGKRIEAEANERIELMKIESSDRQAALKAQVDLVKTEAQLTSNEDIVLLKAQMAQIQAQIMRMSSGAAAESSVPPEPAEAMAAPQMPMGGPPALPPQGPQPQQF
jgi:Phage P22-like portal protein